MLFKILFQDNTEFISNGTYFDTKWKEIQDKPIKQVAFRLPSGDYKVLHDYEAYNFFVEGTENLCIGKRNELSGKKVPRFIYMRGKSRNKIASYRVTLFEAKGKKFKQNTHKKDKNGKEIFREWTTKPKYKISDTTYRILDWMKDDKGKNPSKGWKQGIGEFILPEELKVVPKENK